MEHPSFRFFRPIIWRSGIEEAPWFLGGTATLIRLFDRDFVISARHALSKDGFTLSDAFIPHRLNSQYSVQIGSGVKFTPKNSDEDDTAFLDVQIHALLPHHEDETPWERGEFLDLNGFQHGDERFGLQLSGFPKQEASIDYEESRVRGEGITLGGTFGGMEYNSAGVGLFQSEQLVGMDADGFSGGAITSEVLGNVQFQGIVIQGAGCLEIDFVRFVTADAIRYQISESWHYLTKSEQGAAGNPLPAE